MKSWEAEQAQQEFLTKLKMEETEDLKVSSSETGGVGVGVHRPRRRPQKGRWGGGQGAAGMLGGHVNLQLTLK